MIFGRGMSDPPGPGPLGAAFADSLRSKVGGRSVGVYGVNYPADVIGRGHRRCRRRDQSRQRLTANCPATKVVLGGFSEGAAVIDMLAGANQPRLDAVPRSTPYPYVGDVLPASAPLPRCPLALNDHVAAMAVFGNPLGKVRGPFRAARCTAPAPSTCAIRATPSAATATT